MDFEQFLTQKRIDIETYQQVRPEEWLNLKTLYDLIGQKSFDQQKKFLFNPLRLAFPSKLPLPTKAESTSPKKIIPKTQPIANEQSNLGEANEIPVTPPPSMKKMPPKMKPAMPNVETETKLEGDTPPPFPKKLPAKIKPITATPLEETAPENQVETPPVPKKMPMKMKPVLPNSTEDDSKE